MSGFFFGSTDYDDYYFGSVESVKKWIEDILLPKFDRLEDDFKTSECIVFYTCY